MNIKLLSKVLEGEGTRDCTFREPKPGVPQARDLKIIKAKITRHLI